MLPVQVIGIRLRSPLPFLVLLTRPLSLTLASFQVPSVTFLSSVPHPRSVVVSHIPDRSYVAPQVMMVGWV